MRLAASCFAVVRRFDDDGGEGGVVVVVIVVVVVVSAVELDAGVPRLGALLDRIPVDVLSKGWVFEAGRGLDSSYTMT